MEDEKIYIRRPRPKIESWQKEYNLDGETEFSGDFGDVSLYSYNLAINSYPTGSYVLIEDLITKAMHNEMTITLSELVDRGLAKMFWDSIGEEITWSLTSRGKKIQQDNE